MCGSAECVFCSYVSRKRYENIMKKILLYNWVQFDNEEKNGGGVTVYCNNIVESFCKQEGYQVYFLSSGRAYDLKKTSLRIEETPNKFSGYGVKSYEVVNSPIMAPGYIQFHNVDACTSDESLYELVKKFIGENGGFDVFHLNNLEGLSGGVFKVKDDFPNMKIIFSMHNYYPFCPQVHLWYDDSENCLNYKCGSKCMDCMKWLDRDYEREMLGFEYDYKKENITQAKAGYIKKRKIKRKIKKLLNGKPLHPKIAHRLVRPQEFSNFRKKNVEMLNKYADCVLAVSNRVRELCIRFGVDEDKVFTSYIGTKFAEDQKLPHKLKNKDVYNIIYMGYARRDKGFFFLLKCLMCLDEEYARRIQVTFATKINDPRIANEFESLRKKGIKVIHLDGYNHSQLESILKDQDLGIVPVLWEDNFPQVAIELAAFGVPVLASDLGGANELSKSEYFIFENENVVSFIEKLKKIIENPKLTTDYWEKYKGLPTMDEHIEELKNYYF